VANIRVDTSFPDTSPEEQRNTIIHELLHCHFSMAQSVITDDLWDRRLLSQDAYSTFEASYRRAQEFGVDGVAMAIAQFFPLIDWSEENN
jgi:hypothetical protein